MLQYHEYIHIEKMYLEMDTYRVSEAGWGQINLLFSEGSPNPRSATVLLS